jgi:hypothetical protein
MPKYQVSPHPKNNKSVQRYFTYFLCAIDLDHIILKWNQLFLDRPLPISEYRTVMKYVCPVKQVGIVKIYIPRSDSLCSCRYFFQDITYAVLFGVMAILQKFNKIR